ncbi:MAG: polymorphic toxin-type HINT domain-containing protein [Planctomycetaceae bacterium]
MQTLLAAVGWPGQQRSEWPGELAIISVPIASRRIDQMRPGDWVLAENPTGERDLEFGDEVDPARWRLLHLEAPKEEGGVSDIWMLRPRDWIEAQWRQQQLPQVATLVELPAEADSQLSTRPSQLVIVHDDLTDPTTGQRLPGPPVWTPPFDEQRMAGETLFLSVPEIGIHGDVHVLSIGACPQISPRPGPEFQCVTATFAHSATNVLDLQIEGDAAPIGVTANHPFWSLDRRQFIPAGDLQVGEHLQRADGTAARVIAATPRQGQERVFNLEVQAEHVYHVAVGGVLVHNSCFGSTGFGNTIHGKFIDYLEDFTGVRPPIDRTPPGLTGVDASWTKAIRGLTDEFGDAAGAISHAELKPLSGNGFATFENQLSNWRQGGLQGGVGLFMYDSAGNITFRGVW